MPERIVDLHTHLFNARYVPLASIIANAMNKDESRLANNVASLLLMLVGSSYHEPKTLTTPSPDDEDAVDEFYLERIWSIAYYELCIATGSLDKITSELGELSESPLSPQEINLLQSSELAQIIKELSKANYDAEGWHDTALPENIEAEKYIDLKAGVSLKRFLGGARSALKKALWVVSKLMNKEAWGEKENYLRFFLTMLSSEEKLLERLLSSYGSDLPKLQVVHYMMDMQMAYAMEKPPYYLFHPEQVRRMQLLHRSRPCKVFGFSAFDPRREDWLKHATEAREKGFIGFKFYPAMGYKPTENEPTYQDRIDAFFDFCIKYDMPIFAHCTPTGFQTRHKLGGNAHPKYWKKVLENSRWSDLRLCLGHAGGGAMINGNINSKGWMADSEEEWQDQDNFARIVCELCTTYQNVYCEVGYITQLFEASKLEVFVGNIEKARGAAVKAARPYELLTKMAYGSDWHMPDMVDRTRDYLDIFLKIMRRVEYSEYSDRFFWQNAYAYLKLHK
ncbi:amidohydrolase family protein [Bowmanella yangjiangensis]|nr:amidohydrolase family protein [Bowmanella yangjiangensis]